MSQCSPASHCTTPPLTPEPGSIIRPLPSHCHAVHWHFCWFVHCQVTLTSVHCQVAATLFTLFVLALLWTRKLAPAHTSSCLKFRNRGRKLLLPCQVTPTEAAGSGSQGQAEEEAELALTAWQVAV